MVDSARSQVISSKGLMMLTHEKDPSDDLRRLLIFRSSSILTMRSTRRNAAAAGKQRNTHA